MTREEAIKVLKMVECHGSLTQKAKEMAISALSAPSANVISIDQANAMIKSYVSHYEENKGEWIPVSERLPEIHQDVLLSLRSLDVEVGFRAKTEPYFYCHGGCYIDPQNVLAWQPLPEPYKAESEDNVNDCTRKDERSIRDSI